MITYAAILCLGAIAGLLMGGLLGANRRAKDLQEQGEHYHKVIAKLEQTNREDVARLRAIHAKSEAMYVKNVARDAAELHRRECKNIAKAGKRRKFIEGAGA
jgi:hypothetical protein